MPERLKMFASPRQVREIYNAMAPELIEALKEHLTPNDGEVIDQEYQKAKDVVYPYSFHNYVSDYKPVPNTNATINKLIKDVLKDDKTKIP